MFYLRIWNWAVFQSGYMTLSSKWQYLKGSSVTYSEPDTIILLKVHQLNRYKVVYHPFLHLNFFNHYFFFFFTYLLAIVFPLLWNAGSCIFTQFSFWLFAIHGKCLKIWIPFGTAFLILRTYHMETNFHTMPKGIN